MKKAPDFSLPDQHGKLHMLSQYKGKKVLLYFYPKDDTPGCTTEACSVQENLAQLQTHNVVVLGVSADDAASHSAFAKKFNLTFPLLADTNKEAITAYGVWGEKKMYGKSYMGIRRESFLVDEQGNIKKHFPNVKPKTHVADVLAELAAA